jgi:hypothetical protein
MTFRAVRAKKKGVDSAFPQVNTFLILCARRDSNP